MGQKSNTGSKSSTKEKGRLRKTAIVKIKSQSPVKKPKALIFRSNMVAAMKLMKTIKFSEREISQLKRTPFWNFISALQSTASQLAVGNKTGDDTAEIIETYNKQKKAFQLGESYVKFRTSDVKYIFGIQDGDEEMNFDYCLYPTENDFVNRWFARGTRIDSKVLRNCIAKAQKGKKKTDAKDLARLIVLFLCCTLFFCTSGLAIGWKYCVYLEDMNKMKDFAWSRAIKNCLMNSVHNSQHQNGKGSGCVIALLVITSALEPTLKEVKYMSDAKKKQEQEDDSNENEVAEEDSESEEDGEDDGDSESEEDGEDDGDSESEQEPLQKKRKLRDETSEDESEGSDEIKEKTLQDKDTNSGTNNDELSELQMKRKDKDRQDRVGNDEEEEEDDEEEDKQDIKKIEAAETKEKKTLEQSNQHLQNHLVFIGHPLHKGQHLLPTGRFKHWS